MSDIPTALAPTGSLATPRVRKFVDKVLKALGPAELVNFYEADPFTHDIYDMDSDKAKPVYIEAWWGCKIKTGHLLSSATIYELAALSATIDFWDWSIEQIVDNQIIISFALSARVMRH